jgi:hypothetical protein
MTHREKRNVIGISNWMAMRHPIDATPKGVVAGFSALLG